MYTETWLIDVMIFIYIFEVVKKLNYGYWNTKFDILSIDYIIIG